MQIPGGHLEHGEDVFACAERETLEETGLVVKADRIPTITNDVFKVEAKHYITIYVLCDMVNPDATPKVKQKSPVYYLQTCEIRVGELTLRNSFPPFLQAMEPNKCDGWSWKTQKELRQIHEAAKLDLSVQQLFLPLINLFNQTPDLHALLATDGIANGTL